RVLLLLPRMLLELLLDGLRVGAGRHEVVELVAQRADELGGERLVQYPDRLLAIELVVRGDRPLRDVLARTLAKGLDLLQMGHRLLSSCRGQARARRTGPECGSVVGAKQAVRLPTRSEPQTAAPRQSLGLDPSVDPGLQHVEVVVGQDQIGAIARL